VLRKRILLIVGLLAASTAVMAACSSSSTSSSSTSSSSSSTSNASSSSSSSTSSSAYDDAGVTAKLNAISGLDGTAKVQSSTSGGKLSDVDLHISIANGSNPSQTCASLKAAQAAVAATSSRGWTLKIIDPAGEPFGTLDCTNGAITVPAAGLVITDTVASQIAAAG